MTLLASAWRVGRSGPGPILQMRGAVEEVAVRHCARRGRAINLTLDRARDNRSSVRLHRALPRPPRRPVGDLLADRPACPAGPARAHAPSGGSRTLIIDVESRERYPYRFPGHDVARLRSALPCGDYAVCAGDRLLAAVERKTLEDYITSSRSLLGHRRSRWPSWPRCPARSSSSRAATHTVARLRRSEGGASISPGATAGGS